MNILNSASRDGHQIVNIEKPQKSQKVIFDPRGIFRPGEPRERPEAQTTVNPGPGASAEQGQ
jgi:hypothetical protein